MRRALLLALALAPGCGYTSPEDCVDLGESARASDCWVETVMPLMSTDRAAAEAWVDKIPDAQTRDYIWNEVTIKLNPSDARYCKRIENERVRKSCLDVVHRPHLHRELGAGQNTGASGEAPPPPSGSTPGPRPGPGRGAPPLGGAPGGAAAPQ